MKNFTFSKKILIYYACKKFAVKIFASLLVFMSSAFILHAQTQLEMNVASYPSPPNGPTVANQTATLLENTTGSTFVAFSPAITYTLSFSNQQYTTVTGISTKKGLSFGVSLNSTAKTATSSSVVNTLGAIGTGVDANHTSNPNGTAGTGIDMDDNYGMHLFATAEPLYAASSALNGRYYYGDLTLTFNRPVSDPVLQIVGLGGTFVNSKSQGFNMEYELQTTGVTLSKISGSTYFDVTSNKIVSSNTGAINASCASGGACGSAKVAGTNITTLVFKLYLRGDGKGSAWSDATTFSGDASTLSVTMNKPVTVSGTIYADANGATDDLVNGTGTNAGGTLFANLVDASNKIVASTAVSATGTYSLPAIGAGNYTVSLSTTAGTQAAASPAAALPSAYANTGEGTAAAGDGTVDGVTAITVASADVAGVDFGINQYPTANNKTVASQKNPGGTTFIAVGAANFSGADPDAGGQISAYKFTAFPTYVTSIKIGGTTYTSATFPAAGVTVAAVAGALPAGSVSIDPVSGLVTAVIPFNTIDAGGLVSLTAAAVSVQFTSLLPLKFTSFTATTTTNQVILKWTTADEINTSRFDVQKSSDGIQWELLLTIQAKGNNVNEYTITDNAAFDKINYYRIKESDMDDQFAYSAVLKTANNDNEFLDAVKITPNPVRNTAVIEIHAAKDAIKNITITETTGRKMQSYNLNILKGVNRFFINNVGKWQPGLYYVIVQDSNGSITGSYKLIKE